MRPLVAASSPRSRYLKKARRPGAKGVVLTKDFCNRMLCCAAVVSNCLFVIIACASPGVRLKTIYLRRDFLPLPGFGSTPYRIEHAMAAHRVIEIGVVGRAGSLVIIVTIVTIITYGFGEFHPHLTHIISRTAVAHGFRHPLEFF